MNPRMIAMQELLGMLACDLECAARIARDAQMACTADPQTANIAIGTLDEARRQIEAVHHTYAAILNLHRTR